MLIIEDNMIIAAFILGICIVYSTTILVKSIKEIEKVSISRHATMKCLIDLVTKLNETFPGSNLIIQDTTDEVKVIGELKYYTK